MTALHIEGHELEELPASLVELYVRRIDDRLLAHLAGLPMASHLERLWLDGGQLHDASPLASFPQLVSLALGTVTFGSRGDAASHIAAVRTLTSQPMPALRELRAIDHPEIDSTEELVHAYGAQLDLLDIRAYSAWTLPPELAACLAGDVLEGAWDMPRHLLHVGGRAPEPWLDPAIAS